MKAVSVEQKLSKKGKPYYRVQTDDGQYANSFSPVEVGAEGNVVKNGDFLNFVPIVQQSISGDTPLKLQLDRIEKRIIKLTELVEDKSNKELQI